MSTAALPASFPQIEAASPTIRKPLVTSRMLKVSAAALLLLAGAYGALNESQWVATSNAVVSSYVLDVRTPIEGTLGGLPQSLGTSVRAGQVLARVENPLLDHQHLDNLRLEAGAARSMADALATERRELMVQRDALLSRAAKHQGAMGQRMQEQVAESAHALMAREHALALADKESERGRQLFALGVIATAERDRLVAARDVLAEGVHASQAALESLRRQLEANGRGVLSEPGTNNDVSYSRQRADEIEVKLVENTRALVVAGAQALQSELTADAEAERNAMLSFSEVRAPSSGMLWKLNAMDGEHAAAGSSILSVVDCSRQFVLAEIPQDRLPDVALHGLARIRLSGETEERTGTVIATTGEQQRDLDHKLAAAPLHDQAQESATVLLSLDRSAKPGTPTETACSVGRTARVRIPTVGTSLLSRWFRHSL